MYLPLLWRGVLVLDKFEATSLYQGVRKPGQMSYKRDGGCTRSMYDYRHLHRFARGR